LHKEPSLKARLEWFATNITVLEMYKLSTVRSTHEQDNKASATLTAALKLAYL